jgi:hypothetical protein
MSALQITKEQAIVLFQKCYGGIVHEHQLEVVPLLGKVYVLVDTHMGLAVYQVVSTNKGLWLFVADINPLNK